MFLPSIVPTMCVPALRWACVPADSVLRRFHCLQSLVKQQGKLASGFLPCTTSCFQTVVGKRNIPLESQLKSQIWVTNKKCLTVMLPMEWDQAGCPVPAGHPFLGYALCSSTSTSPEERSMEPSADCSDSCVTPVGFPPAAPSSSPGSNLGPEDKETTC